MSDRHQLCSLQPLYGILFLSVYVLMPAIIHGFGYTHNLPHTENSSESLQGTQRSLGHFPCPASMDLFQESTWKCWKLPAAAAGGPQVSQDSKQLPPGLHPALSPLAHPSAPLSSHLPARTAALERDAGGRFQMVTSFISGTSYTCWTNAEMDVVQNRSPWGRADCLGQILMPRKGEGKKKHSLEETLKIAFQKPRSLGTVPHLT